MAIEKIETYEFAVGETPVVSSRSAAGHLTVTAGSDGQVRIRVTKRVRNGLLGGASELDLEKVRVDVTQNGDRISIDADTRGFALLGKQVTIDIDMVIPQTTDLDLRLAAGHVNVRGIAGVLAAKVDAGNLDVSEVRLRDRSRLTVNAGNLTVRGALAPSATVEVQVTAGNARFALPRDSATYLDARAQAGTIWAGDWPVSVTRNFATQAAYGPLAADPAGTLTIRVNAGNIAIDHL